jgi:putative ABC transport system permease protein
MVRVSGMGAVPVTAYDGPAGWLGWPLVGGRWYLRPGEVDVSSAFLTQSGLAVGDRITLHLGGRAAPARIVGQVFALGGPGVFTSWSTLGGGPAGLAPAQYDIGLRPGTSPQAYASALTRALGRSVFVSLPQPGTPGFGLVDTSYIRLLTILMAVLAGLGVLNSVLLVTREQVHDLGVFKAVGMTPRQAIAMVVCSVAGTGLAAGVIAVPAGVALHRYVLPRMAAAAGTDLPASFLNVYRVPELAILALAGIVIAVAGALLPAAWAARAETASALHAE